MKPVSIRARLTLWFAASSVAVLTLLAVTVLIVERAVLERSARDSLAGDLAVVVSELGREPDDLAQPGRAGLAEAYAVWRADEPVYVSPGWRHFGLSTERGETGRRRVYDREVRVLYNSADTDPPLTVAVAHDETTATEAVRLLGLVILGSAPLALLCSLAAGWFVAGQALEPTRSLRRKLERITADRLEERIHVGRPGDEFGKLSSVLNATLNRLQRAMDTQRRFAADASHQLRTPLAAQRAIGEAALTRHAGHAEPLAEAVASMLEEADRLASLTSGLLELARTERAADQCETIDLLDLVRAIVARVEPLIDSAGHRITVSGHTIAVSTASEALARALTGVIENAIVHCPPPCTIHVAVGRNDDSAFVDVRDDGPGIHQSETEAIFEPFHRGADSTDKPGSGLGLALARAAAAAACAQLTLTSPRPTTFRFTFPLERSGT